MISHLQKLINIPYYIIKEENVNDIKEKKCICILFFFKLIPNMKLTINILTI